MPMSDNELLAIVNDAERDALRYAGEWIRENEDYLKRYYRMPYGDEVEGQSQVISSDVADVVESDMPSLVRVFLGAKDIMQFEPVSGSDADKREAAELPGGDPLAVRVHGERLDVVVVAVEKVLRVTVSIEHDPYGRGVVHRVVAAVVV